MSDYIWDMDDPMCCENCGAFLNVDDFAEITTGICEFCYELSITYDEDRDDGDDLWMDLIEL